MNVYKNSRSRRGIELKINSVIIMFYVNVLEVIIDCQRYTLCFTKVGTSLYIPIEYQGGYIFTLN